MSSPPEAFDLKGIYPQTWPPQPLAFDPGIRQSRFHPFPDDGPLKFSTGKPGGQVLLVGYLENLGVRMESVPGEPEGRHGRHRRNHLHRLQGRLGLVD